MKSWELNGTKMKEIAEKNETAGIVALSLAIRERMRSYVNLERLRNQLKRAGNRIVESDYIHYWKDLELENLGYMTYDKRDKPLFFYFHCDMRSVGKSSIEGTNQKAAELVDNHRPRYRNVPRKVLTEEKRTYKPFKLSIDIPDDADAIRIQKLLNTIKSI